MTFELPPVVVKVFVVNAVAMCIPSVQGLLCDSLWDSGATLTLMDSNFALKAIQRGGVESSLTRHVSIEGIGDGRLMGQAQVVATLRFLDGKPRQITAVVVRGLCCELIIGLDFMCQERIALEPRVDRSFMLLDAVCTPHAVIYDSQQQPIRSIHTQVEDIDEVYLARCATATHVGSVEVGSALDQELQDGWEKLPHENRELICLLASIQMHSLDEIDLRVKLAQTSFSFEPEVTDRVLTANKSKNPP